MKIYEKFKVKFLITISMIIITNMIAVYTIQKSTFNRFLDKTTNDNIDAGLNIVEREFLKKRDHVNDIGIIVSNSNDAALVLKERGKSHVNINIDRYVHNFPDIYIEVFDKNGKIAAKGLNVNKITDSYYIKKAVETPFYYTEIKEIDGKIYMKNYSTVRDNKENVGVVVVSAVISDEYLKSIKGNSPYDIIIYNEKKKRVAATNFEITDEGEKEKGVLKAGEREIFGKSLIIKVVFDNKKIEETKKTIMLKVWYVNIGFVVLSLIILNILATTIIRPMNEIITGLNEIKNGNLKYRIPDKTSGEIGAAIKSFNDTVEILKETKESEKRIYNLEKIAAAGRLASGVAHEIKNPLASMDMIIEVYRRKFDTIKFKREDFDLLSGEIKRINAILESLMNFSRSENILISEYDISEIVKDIFQLVEKNISAGGNIIKTICVGNGFMIKCDKNLMKQMLLNIVLNSNEAVKNGSIELALNGKEDKIWIEISDNGKGIEEEILGKIFEPFFTTKVNGNGIGLAVVKKIADIHEFEIEVRSVKEKGTHFIIKIDRERNKKLEVKNIDISNEIFFRRNK